MHIPRLYITGPLASGDVVRLDEQAAHHVRQVLRLAEGAALKVFDGNGPEYHASLIGAGRGRVSVRIGDACAAPAGPSLEITLAQGIARGDRMDLILQKAVELGVRTIQPLWMERCQGRVTGERLDRRMRHWRKVIISACEQCGRSTLPELAEPAAFAAWLDTGRKAATRIVLQPGTGSALHTLDPTGNTVELLVGPEGGITDAEHADARRAGFTAVALGPRILRTETAAIAALAGLHALWGDFR